jgi:hypothetical protein
VQVAISLLLAAAIGTLATINIPIINVAIIAIVIVEAMQIVVLLVHYH